MTAADIVTPFGVIWRIASAKEFSLFIILILLVVIFLMLVKYLQILQTREINNHQLFLFKMKRLGLSNFQIKIMNNMVRILRLSNPTEMLNQSGYFESAMGRFLKYLQNRNEQPETLASIGKDVSVIYEKLYHPARFRKPLSDIKEIDDEQLLFFSTEEGVSFLGRVTIKDEDTLAVSLFRDQSETIFEKAGEDINAYLWRSGDAEYTFKTKIREFADGRLLLETPGEFFRGREAGHPYVDAIVPAELMISEPGALEEAESLKATIYKINDYEAIIRTAHKLNYNKKYSLVFELMDFNFSIITRIISRKTIEEGSIFYYTLKFTEMSNAAQKVLKRFIYEHL